MISSQFLEDPNTTIMVIENGTINNNKIYINDSCIDKIFLPTMYISLTRPQECHIDFEIKEYNEVKNNNVLYIFDTWGTSSYYHLLLDHIIPLWITTQIIGEKLQINNTSEIQYLRISNNKYTNELKSINNIFKYFMNKNFEENIVGEYKYIIYGYCYNYRPFNMCDNRYFPKYKYWIDTFINKFKKQSSEETYILIPERLTRTYEYIDKIYNELKIHFNVKKVDFANITIDEQIQLCASAWAMIGCEGAAFANQIFMKEKSLIIYLHTEFPYFHTPLSNYMEHEYHILYYNILSYDMLFKNILNICKEFIS